MQKNIMFVLAGVLFSLSSFAASVYVSQPSGSLKAEDEVSIRELMKIAADETPGFKVTENAKEADVTINTQVVKLGDSYILNAKKVNKSGTVLFSEKMKAATMEDMDTVTARLGKSVLLEKPVLQTGDVTNVTEAEENQNTRRIEATRQWIFSIGPGWATNLRSKGGGLTFAVGYLWGLDPDFAVNLSWQLHNGKGNDDASYSDFSLGMEYFFSRSKTSPFVGARLGYASAKPNGNCTISFFNSCDTSRASGWAANATAGVKFFRTSSVNVGLIATYHTVFDKVGGNMPGLFTTQMAVYF